VDCRSGSSTGGPGFATEREIGAARPPSWIAGNSRYLLENNFGISAAEADRFPRDRVFIAPKDGRPRHKEGYDVFPPSEPQPR
jgi:hypothetical protein